MIAWLAVGASGASTQAAAETPHPVSLTSWRDAALRGTPETVLLQPSARLQLDSRPEEGSAAWTEGSSKSRYALPMLLSALVPGAGEIATGHWWNGLPLVAADVATWIGYAHYQSEGDAWKETYQRFADDHWAEDRWQTNLRLAHEHGSNDWSKYWNPELPPDTYCDCSPPYIPKEEDAREYYENLGKYKHFYPGWDDFDKVNFVYDPEDPNTRRRQYVDMRIESNDNYDNAHALLGVAAATRIVSVIQSYWLVRRDTRREGLRLQPMTFGGFGSGLRLDWSF